jgi:hypothetical protein
MKDKVPVSTVRDDDTSLTTNEAESYAVAENTADYHECIVFRKLQFSHCFAPHVRTYRTAQEGEN